MPNIEAPNDGKTPTLTFPHNNTPVYFHISVLAPLPNYRLPKSRRSLHLQFVQKLRAPQTAGKSTAEAVVIETPVL